MKFNWMDEEVTMSVGVLYTLASAIICLSAALVVVCWVELQYTKPECFEGVSEADQNGTPLPPGSVVRVCFKSYFEVVGQDHE